MTTQGPEQRERTIISAFQSPRSPAGFQPANDDVDLLDSHSDGADAPARMRVPTNFMPVAVYRCNVLPTLGETTGPTADRLDGDLDALLKVLATPDSGVSNGVSEGGEELCTLTREYSPELWLVDADGRAMRPQWPSNASGKTLLGGVDILNALVPRRFPLRCAWTWFLPARAGVVSPLWRTRR